MKFATSPISALAVFLLLAGCASAPQPPTDAFQAADIAIANADREKASEFAPVEIKSAHDKMTEARIAAAKDADEKDVMKARRLADEAQADAELASALAKNERNRAINAEMQKSIDTLRMELQRNTGGAS